MKDLNKYLSFLCFLFVSLGASAQDDLMNQLEEDWDDDDKTAAIAAFKGLKIVNFESTKLADKGDFYFVVAHRFGSVERGIDNLFGLDNAVTKLSFIYAPWEGFNVGFGRSSYRKIYGFHIKYRLAQQQEEGFPFTIVGYNLLTIDTQFNTVAQPQLTFNDRLSHTVQVLISRKVNPKLSLQLAPSLLHENTVFYDPQDNTQFILGVGGRHKISKRLSLNADYGWHLSRAEGSPFNNSLSVGVDIETGGHVFQLHFTNAQPMFENGFLANGNGDWGEGVFFFGFNISRVF